MITVILDGTQSLHSVNKAQCGTCRRVSHTMWRHDTTPLLRTQALPLARLASDLAFPLLASPVRGLPLRLVLQSHPTGLSWAVLRLGGTWLLNLRRATCQTGVVSLVFCAAADARPGRLASNCVRPGYGATRSIRLLFLFLCARCKTLREATRAAVHHRLR